MASGITDILIVIPDWILEIVAVGAGVGRILKRDKPGPGGNSFGLAVVSSSIVNLWGLLSRGAAETHGGMARDDPAGCTEIR